MKPSLSIMHGLRLTIGRVIWGGRWQDEGAASTGEEVEQINSHIVLPPMVYYLGIQPTQTGRSLKNELDNSSKQRTRLRSKTTAEKAKLTSRVQRYNEKRQCACDEHALTSTQCTLSEIMNGNFPWGYNEDTPIRIKIMIVEKHEIMKRWEEEVSLLKKEMVNFISW
ncbi:unnamed protein product [Porites lobata]|uniref:SUZ domain-containing protein n=1 Tax=Porites lobata TaxID=104759 RepID=A0ABN8P6U6_9CNID|nr:unnamed protein product [Porites lobata]